MWKRLILISVLAAALIAWCLPALADQSATDQAGNVVPYLGTKAPGDILFNCDVQSIPDDDQVVGIETFNDTVYITGAGGTTHGIPNWVHVWTLPGGVCTYQYSVAQPTGETWGWRDIACDGEYLYASDDRILECFYVTPIGVVLVAANNITISGMADITVVRAVAYDEDHDWFWTANFSSNIYAFDRSGNMTAGPYANTYDVYGMAYDNDSPGGPFLWVHTQDSVKVRQFNPGTGTYTGVVYTGYGEATAGAAGIAGGLCVMEGNESKGSVTLLGITQGTPFDAMYGMEIHVQEDSLYWKPPYENYAPSGMPDISQFQEWWYKMPTGEHTFCGPCAVANCFMWFDAKYDTPAGFPGDGSDQFPLVRQYIDAVGGLTCPWDDHDPWNVEHLLGTPWQWGATPPPPPTPQPFVPGPQPPGMPPWGELVERLAWHFDTDGVRFGYCSHLGTQPMQMYLGIQDWFNSETFEDGSNLMDTFCVNLRPMPSFAEVESLVEKCEDVILLLGFWWNAGGGGEQLFIRGDVNEDGIVDAVDIEACALGGPFSCDDAADVNDDGILNQTDCDYLLDYLYGPGGPPPPPPFPDCGVDPTADGLNCASFPPCPGSGWFRCGGHYVTVAGVNSEEYLIALSDPYYDNAELGGRGRVLDGFIISHTPGHSPEAHNDLGNVSHDIYNVIDDPVSPGGLWELADYPLVERPWYCDDWTGQNVPLEFEGVTMPWPGGEVPVFVEVEYAIQISPWDYRGDVNVAGGDGEITVGDAIYILNWLFRGGPVPDPLIEGDTSCDGLVDLSDAILILNYLFKHGPVLRCCDP